MPCELTAAERMGGNETQINTGAAPSVGLSLPLTAPSCGYCPAGLAAEALAIRRSLAGLNAARVESRLRLRTDDHHHVFFGEHITPAKCGMFGLPRLTASIVVGVLY